MPDVLFRDDSMGIEVFIDHGQIMAVLPAARLKRWGLRRRLLVLNSTEGWLLSSYLATCANTLEQFRR